MIDEGILWAITLLPSPLPQIPLEEAQEDVVSLHEYMEENFDCTMTLFRFPYGEFSEQMLGHDG